MALSQLEQVKLDAERITLKRIQDAKENKAWQESQDRTLTLDDKPEVEAVKEVKAKTVKTKETK